MDSQTVLVKAREIIADPSHWHQRTSAKNELGNHTSAVSPDAVSWCAYGALQRAAGSLDSPLTALAALKLRRHTGMYATIVSFNDASTHEEVLELFDKAIGE